MELKKDRYILFPSKAEANDFIREIDSIMTSHWGDPIVNPYTGMAIVPWNDEHLKRASHLALGRKAFSPIQASEKGWNFGYHQGAFAKASTKLEDALFSREALDAFDTYPNFPAYRATFYGILASLYGVKEALRQTTKALNGGAIQWWNSKFKEIQSDQLLKLFYDLHNSDKHDLQIKYLRPDLNLYSYSGPAPDIVSGEGVFSVINHGTKEERRIFYKGGKMSFSCRLDVSPLIHKGRDVSMISLKEQTDSVISHYRDLVWEGKASFPTPYS